MKLPVTIHTAEFRVIRPAQPLTRAALTDCDRYLAAYLDQHAARTIAGLWLLAARSPRSLIHLPIRTNNPPAHDTTGRRLDLVLLHHSLQFAPARWKQLRHRLGPGRPHTATLPEADHLDDLVIDHAARHHRDNRDLFHQHLHAETLFMTGSARVFRETADRFLDIARNGPDFVPGYPHHQHYCTELHTADGVLGNARELHIEYCDRWTDGVRPDRDR